MSPTLTLPESRIFLVTLLIAWPLPDQFIRNCSGRRNRTGEGAKRLECGRIPPLFAKGTRCRSRSIDTKKRKAAEYARTPNASRVASRVSAFHSLTVQRPIGQAPECLLKFSGHGPYVAMANLLPVDGGDWDNLHPCA